MKEKNPAFWPNGARLVISFSMQFEVGGHPQGAESPFSGSPLPKDVPDLAAESWFLYGVEEGIPRLLDLWDKHGIQVTSHMVGEAARRYPHIAREIAARGHEVAAHGIVWGNQWGMSYEQELDFVKQGLDALEEVTGKRAVGYNCNWLRRSKNTLRVLQQLDFLYHIDDVSRDEPFFMMVLGKKFMVIPYTLRNNDIVNLEAKHWPPGQWLYQLKADFDQLYEEGAKKRRMMSVSTHDRIGGTPSSVRVLDEFITYAKHHKDVVFMRKDEIALLVKEDLRTPESRAEALYNS